MKRGLYLAPFDELADPRLLAELARVAESRGWDGLYLWDRIAYPPSDRAVARETVTLDHLRNGRLILGIGLGNPDDLRPYGPWPRKCDGSGKRQIRLGEMRIGGEAANWFSEIAREARPASCA
jgi:alkanesulfonate monooxygenase SsuD/methylene tetrahydromethanopterin reductase-like flavin-dependent oxidoreductase (luciferase family)